MHRMKWFCCCTRKGVLSRQLFVFDFDKTIVTRDSDKIFKHLLADLRRVPSTDKCLNQEFNWKQRGRPLVDHVIEHGVTPDVILQAVCELDLVIDIDKALGAIKKFLKTHPRSRLLILSTSNDLFIESRLASLQPAIHASKIIANHAEINHSHNNIQYEELANPDPNCPLCLGGFCKGAALVSFLDSHPPFDRIHFICDGGSDLCAALRLSENDVVYVRAGESLDSILQAGIFRGFEIQLRATIKRWSNGLDLVDDFKEYI